MRWVYDRLAVPDHASADFTPQTISPPGCVLDTPATIVHIPLDEIDEETLGDLCEAHPEWNADEHDGFHVSRRWRAGGVHFTTMRSAGTRIWSHTRSSWGQSRWSNAGSATLLRGKRGRQDGG